jgi:hypothetical protein
MPANGFIDRNTIARKPRSAKTDKHFIRLPQSLPGEKGWGEESFWGIYFSDSMDLTGEWN